MKSISDYLLHNRYRLKSILGAGGQAVVYRAMDETLSIERAIKVLSPQLLYETRARHRFESEARIMAGLDHPNIVQIFDIVNTNQYLFIVMELLGCQSLWDWSKDHGPLPEQSIIPLLDPILSAIQKAHQEGIVHRDIKPSNILLTASGVPKLTDFGIAHIQPKDADSQFTKTGTVMGTWGYMSPEQRQNSKSVDARSDIYALGATFYALVTGNKPIDLFACSHDDSLLHGLSSAMMQIIQKCTAYTANERYDSVEDLRIALQEAESTLKPIPNGFSQPTGQPQRAVAATPSNHPDVLSLFSIISNNSSYSDHTYLLPSGLADEKTVNLKSPSKTGSIETIVSQTEMLGSVKTQITPSTQPPFLEDVPPIQKKNRPNHLILAVITIALIFWGAKSVLPSHSQHNTHQSCQILAKSLLNQQHEDGGFSGIPQLPSSLWDSAQQITALEYSRICDIDTSFAQEKVKSAMNTWMTEEIFEHQNGYGAAWFYLSTANLGSPELTVHAETLLERFRLENGAYSVTYQAQKNTKSDPYATTMAAWAMLQHKKTPSDEDFRLTVKQLQLILENDTAGNISGLEEQAWWVLSIIGQEFPEFAPSVEVNRRVAQHMISRCKWDTNRKRCDMPTWPSGKIEFIQRDGNLNSLITQGLPWAAITSTALMNAPGLDKETQKQIHALSNWTNHRLSQSPETLANAPGYILSESLIAVALHVPNH